MKIHSLKITKTICCFTSKEKYKVFSREKRFSMWIEYKLEHDDLDSAIKHVKDLVKISEEKTTTVYFKTKKQILNETNSNI